jgi:hypothetical protein
MGKAKVTHGTSPNNPLRFFNNKREGSGGRQVVSHAKAVTFQLAEVAVPRELFAAILGRIGRLRAAPSPG